jgi:hypothetical protein
MRAKGENQFSNSPVELKSAAMTGRLPNAAEAIFRLTRRANQWLGGAGPIIAKGTSLMSEQFDTSSELIKISKLNGSFRRNYGTFIGAFLYLRSISAARGRSFFWTGLISIACSAALAWLARHGLAWLHVD